MPRNEDLQKYRELEDLLLWWIGFGRDENDSLLESDDLDTVRLLIEDVRLDIGAIDDACSA